MSVPRKENSDNTANCAVTAQATTTVSSH